MRSSTRNSFKEGTRPDCGTRKSVPRGFQTSCHTNSLEAHRRSLRRGIDLACPLRIAFGSAGMLVIDQRLKYESYEPLPKGDNHGRQHGNWPDIGSD